MPLEATNGPANVIVARGATSRRFLSRRSPRATIGRLKALAHRRLGVDEVMLSCPIPLSECQNVRMSECQNVSAAGEIHTVVTDMNMYVDDACLRSIPPHVLSLKRVADSRHETRLKE